MGLWDSGAAWGRYCKPQTIGQLAELFEFCMYASHLLPLNISFALRIVRPSVAHGLGEQGRRTIEGGQIPTILYRFWGPQQIEYLLPQSVGVFMSSC